MNYKVIPVTERILASRELVKTLVVGTENDPYLDGSYRMFCTGDRFITIGFLEGWVKHKNAPTTKLRRSLAEAEELLLAKPVIYENDLLCGRLWLPRMNAEEQKHYDALCEAFDNSPFPLHLQRARKDHIGLDFNKLITVGVDNIIAELKDKLKEFESRSELMDADLSVIESCEFCQCCIYELEALIDLANRYSEYAAVLSEGAVGKRRRELIRMSEAMKKVPAKPAESFFEAIQSVHFFLSNLFGLYALGRPDRYLIKFYEEDIASGKITREEAQELIDFFCLGVSDRVFSRAACGFMVGGQTESGELVENELTYMFLTALEHIKMSDPNGALCVNSKTSREIIEYAVEILSGGITHPAFFNDDVIVSSLSRLGVERYEAVEYIHSTCAEITVSGCSRGHTTAVLVDMPRLFVEAVAGNPDADSIDALLSIYSEKIKSRLRCGIREYEYAIVEANRNGNEPMRICCFIDDCMKRCREPNGGGAKYVFIQPIFIGFATALDSIVAVNELCFKQNRLTTEEFCEIIADNFEGNEALRQYVINRLPHYGNDDDRIDPMAARLAGMIRDISYQKLSGNKFLVPGTFSYISHACMGSVMGATFDGRSKGKSYSDGCCPTQGRDVNGPTAMINSLTGWDQSDFLAGMVVNVKFSKSVFNESRKRQLADLICTFIKRGGIEIQINSVDRATLEDAIVHPEDHADLLVRIGGYSDYFVRLTPTMQEEIIERTEY